MLEYEINQLEIPFLDLFLDLHQKGDDIIAIPNSIYNIVATAGFEPTT